MPPSDEAWLEEDADTFDDAPEPPHGVRFGEGQPINRRGRPRGSPNNAKILRRVASKRHCVVIDGVARRMNTLELVIIAVRKRAAAGDLQALKLIEALSAQCQSSVAKRHAVLITGKRMTEDEWEAYYDKDLTEEEFAARYPYLAVAHREHRRNSAEIERQCSADGTAHALSHSVGPRFTS